MVINFNPHKSLISVLKVTSKTQWSYILLYLFSLFEFVVTLVNFLGED